MQYFVRMMKDETKTYFPYSYVKSVAIVHHYKWEATTMQWINGMCKHILKDFPDVKLEDIKVIQDIKGTRVFAHVSVPLNFTNPKWEVEVIEIDGSTGVE